VSLYKPRYQRRALMTPISEQRKVNMESGDESPHSKPAATARNKPARWRVARNASSIRCQRKPAGSSNRNKFGVRRFIAAFSRVTVQAAINDAL
jgi:hypothetical protein